VELVSNPAWTRPSRGVAFSTATISVDPRTSRHVFPARTIHDSADVRCRRGRPSWN
jgi:hypothetical protein